MYKRRNKDTLCANCWFNKVHKTRKDKHWVYLYSRFCSFCKRIKQLWYYIHKKDKCEHCWFVPIHSCQLDVHHIDWNSNNNSINNLQTLCANCHRLTTLLQRDNKKEIKNGRVQYKIWCNIKNMERIKD
jgi:hypothetical protein